MKRLLIVSMAALALALVPMAAAADEGGGDQHFGPFAGTSPDSGTCGNDWAADTFTRNFFVHPNANGTFRVIETFSNGKFVTVVGASPGACNSGSNNGSTVAAGIMGRFGGFLNGTVSGGTYNPHGCDVPAPCTTTKGFLLVVFGPGAKYTCIDGPADQCSFFFGYFAPDQGLKSHVWINASPDLGGNRGDIATL